MATITGYTAERMKEIEDSAIVDGDIVGNDLVLSRRDGAQINAGSVIGPVGPQGYAGEASFRVVTSTTRPTSPTIGLMIYESDTHRIFSWNGTAWIYRGGIILCSSTTRPSNPFTGLMIYETDTKQFFVWTNTQWVTPGGVTLCTSTTRPTGPFLGLMIYETDTKKVWTFDGSTWNLPKNISGGTLGFVQIAGTPALGNGIAINIAGLSLTVIVGASRRIRISARMNVYTDGQQITASFHEVPEVALDLLANAFNSTPSFNRMFTNAVILTPTAGVHTYYLRGFGDSAKTTFVDANSQMPAYLLVEDIGGV